MGGEAHAHFADDPNQLIRVRPCKGWSLVIRKSGVPEGTKPQYRTFATYAQARENRVFMLMKADPDTTIEITPYVPPEKKPERPRHHATIDAETGRS
jgi:hypothetical protein